MNFDIFKEKIGNRADKVGFSEWELFYKEKDLFSVNVFSGEINKYNINKSMVIYFRGNYNGKIGSAYTEVMDDEAVELLIEKGRENAEVIDNAGEDNIFKGEESYPQINAYNIDIRKFKPSEKIRMAKQLEKCVYNVDKKVMSTKSCGLSTEEESTKIVNSKGLDIEFKSNIIKLFVEPIVRNDNGSCNMYDEIITRNLNDLDIEKLAEKSVREAIDHLDGETIKSDKYKVILSNKVSAKLLDAFKSVFSGDLAMRVPVYFKDKIGEKVASSVLTIRDNPLTKSSVSVRSFDDEGVACQNKNIIENGVFNTFLHNRESAKSMGVESTGNAVMDIFFSKLTVLPINMYVQCGEKNKVDMIKSLENGLIIDELSIGFSGTSTETGNFSYRGRALKVENGSIKGAIEQIVVSGNYYELLKDVLEVGADMYFIRNDEDLAVGSPSLLINKLSIAGK